MDNEIDAKAVAKSLFSYYYSPEPCRICGELIGDDENAVYAGYSLDSKSRAAHGACWDAHKGEKSKWAYPEDAED